jgi:hypothetical protein
MDQLTNTRSAIPQLELGLLPRTEAKTSAACPGPPPQTRQSKKSNIKESAASLPRGSLKVRGFLFAPWAQKDYRNGPRGDYAEHGRPLESGYETKMRMFVQSIWSSVEIRSAGRSSFYVRKD